MVSVVSGQLLPTRTIPHCIGISPDEWYYWFVMVLVRLFLGIVALVGNSWALFLSGGELSPVRSCPRTGICTCQSRRMRNQRVLMNLSYFMKEGFAYGFVFVII